MAKCFLYNLAVHFLSYLNIKSSFKFKNYYRNDIKIAIYFFYFNISSESFFFLFLSRGRVPPPLLNPPCPFMQPASMREGWKRVPRSPDGRGVKANSPTRLRVGISQSRRGTPKRFSWFANGMCT